MEILIASPNQAQLEALRGKGYASTLLPLDCQVCGQHEATNSSTSATLMKIAPSPSVTPAMIDCAPKYSTMSSSVFSVVRPYPGEKWIYQPVELDECADWNVVPGGHGRSSRYHSGHLSAPRLAARQFNLSRCWVQHRGTCAIACPNRGFGARESMWTANDIEVARLLGSYMRRDSVAYIQSDAHGLSCKYARRIH